MTTPSGSPAPQGRGGRRRRRGRHTRRKSYRAPWLGVTSLALITLAVVIRPEGDGLGAATAASLATPTAGVGTPAVDPRPAAEGVGRTSTRPTLTPSTTKPSAGKPNPKPAPVVTHSTGRLAVVAGTAKASATTNTITYRLEIEQGLPFDGAEVAAAVHRALTDPRGWQTVRGVHFERIDRGDPDLRIIVATPALTDRLCLPLLTGGEVSCRVEDRVVLNAKRWAYGIPDYGGKLDLYRTYLVNHEVGHSLGYGHSTCTKPGAPAPVMMQQTKGLAGCLPNPWPTVKAT